MEQRWKEILKERSSTILDSLLGLALGLSAYSLTGFALEALRDVGLALIYFSLLFFLALSTSAAPWHALMPFPPHAGRLWAQSGASTRSSLG